MGAVRAQRSRKGKLTVCVHRTGTLVDLSDTEREERGTRFLLRHLHRVRDHSNYVGDRDAEEDQEIGGDEEQKGNE